jgi:TetR/AcrR family transcriptional regulator, cholesterol catabolism regulator
MSKKFDVEEKVLEKSIDLFYKHGFVKASLRDIAKAVGITSSTVYLYFKNKDEILFNIIFNCGAELLKGLQTVMENQDDPMECLRAMILWQICFSSDTKNSKKLKIFLEEQYRLSPYLRKKAFEQHRQIYDLYFSRVCGLAKNGMGEKPNKTVTTFSILAMINWVYRWFDPDGKLSIEEVAENVIDLFFRGILNREGVKNKNQMALLSGLRSEREEGKSWDTATSFMK